MNKSRLLLLIIFILFGAASCSSGTSNSPISPDVQNPEPGMERQVSSDRIPLGAYSLTLGEDGDYSLVEVREAFGHYDVTAFVLPPGCPDCFWIVLAGKYGDIWEFDAFLKNPTPITAYDVRGTIFESGPVDVINPDSYTSVLAPVSDPNKVNPFFILNSGAGNNQWGPLAQSSAHLILKKPVGVGWGTIEFLIDASWPGNQKDPVRVKALKAEPYVIHDDGSDSCTLSCKVDDWQMDVDSVSINLSPMGGEADAAFTWDDEKWVLPDVSHDYWEGQGPGVYDLLVTAISGGKETYNYLRLTVEEGGISEEPAEWTFLVYLHAANLPDEEDINEMEMSGSVTGELNIIVLWDKPEGEGDDVIMRVLHDPNPYDGTDQTLVSVEVNDYGAVIPSSKQLDMGDGETLRKFLEWAMLKYHAYHYALDLWDHGGGIFSGVEKQPLFRNVCGGLMLWEIRDAMQSALDKQSLVSKFEIVGFDVCVLGEIETAYQLRNLTNYVVASEAGEPGPGWDYGPPLISLKDNIATQTASEFTYNIVEAYRDSYDEDPAPYHYSADTTQAGSSTTTLVDTLVPELDALADALIAIVGDHKSAITQCRNNALNFYDPSFPDLGHFLLLLSQNPQIPPEVKTQAMSTLDALDQTMVLHAHTGTEYINETGFRIWFPDNIDGNYYESQYMDPAYLNFHETNWDEFLYAYGNPNNPVQLAIEEVVVDDTAGGNGDGYLQANETALISIKLRNDGYVAAEQLNCWLQEDDDYVDVTSDFSVCDDIPAGESRWITNDYIVDIDAGCPEQHAFLFNLYITDTDDKIYTPEFQLYSYQIEYLILDYDHTNSSAPAIGAALDTIGIGYATVDDSVSMPDLSEYTTIFVCLGFYGGPEPCHSLSHDEGQAIVDFLDAGGAAYVEGGDCWYFDPIYGAYDIAPAFGIDPIEDGGYDELVDIIGATGSDFYGLQFSYSGDDWFPDHLAPLGGGLAWIVMISDAVPFSCMIAYDSGTYRTLGASFEFGGLNESASVSTQVELMQEMLEFFDG